jgi:hypothetical protein
MICKKNKRMEFFSEVMAQIHFFCLRGDTSDWKRCLVCGILWTGNGVAINIRKLKLLLDKSKSSINGSLQRIGLKKLPKQKSNMNLMIRFFPLLESNFQELREWTVREFYDRAKMVCYNQFNDRRRRLDKAPPRDLDKRVSTAPAEKGAVHVVVSSSASRAGYRIRRHVLSA